MYRLSINNFNTFLQSYQFDLIAYGSIDYIDQLDEFLRENCLVADDKLGFARIAALKTILRCDRLNRGRKVPCVFHFPIDEGAYHAQGSILTHIVTKRKNNILHVTISIPREDVEYCDLV